MNATLKTRFYVIKVQTMNGGFLNWTLGATSPAKAVMAAQDLCPQCEIVSVHLEGQW